VTDSDEERMSLAVAWGKKLDEIKQIRQTDKERGYAILNKCVLDDLVADGYSCVLPERIGAMARLLLEVMECPVMGDAWTDEARSLIGEGKL